MKLNFKLKSSTQKVFSILSDAKLFEKFHPVIFKIDDLGNDNYLIHETLKFLLIPITFTYPAKILSNKEKGMVQMNAVVMKLVKVELNFLIKEFTTYTEVVEDIKINSWLPAHPVMMMIFKKQHGKLFLNIDADLVS
jgi:hypothetical protein